MFYREPKKQQQKTTTTTTTTKNSLVSLSRPPAVTNGQILHSASHTHTHTHTHAHAPTPTPLTTHSRYTFLRIEMTCVLAASLLGCWGLLGCCAPILTLYYCKSLCLYSIHTSFLYYKPSSKSLGTLKTQWGTKTKFADLHRPRLAGDPRKVVGRRPQYSIQMHHVLHRDAAAS